MRGKSGTPPMASKVDRRSARPCTGKDHTYDKHTVKQVDESYKE
jgi:hypothetical protein